MKFLLPALLLLTACGHAQDSAVAASSAPAVVTTAGGGATAAAEPTSKAAATHSPSASPVTEALAVANAIREKNGLPKFSADPILSAIAQAQAEDMLRRHYFDHNTPEGLSPFDRMDKAGLRYNAAAENIAMGETDPHAVFQMWLASPGHKKNLLNKVYLRSGIGYAGGHWVHDFAD